MWSSSRLLRQFAWLVAAVLAAAVAMVLVSHSWDDATPATVPRILAGFGALCLVAAGIGWMRVRTLRREVREAMRQLLGARREAEMAMVAKSNFLANMSHEIRTPMNGIIGTTSLALETPLTAQQRDMLKIIHASGQSLLHMLNDVLDYSKLESATMVLSETPTDLRKLFREIGEMFAPVTAERDLEFLHRVDPGIPAWIQVDPERLKQILVNLVGNATKFTERGEIQLRATVAASAGPVPRIRIEVEDTGIGIAREKLQTIFEVFHQADATTTRKYGGSGLGLAISRKLSELMKGAITVRSEDGRGSVFALEFPYRAVPVQGEVAGRERWSGVLRGRRVAVIARESLATQMADYLAGTGAEPILANGVGPGDLARIAAGNPELVVVATNGAAPAEMEAFIGRLTAARFPVVVVGRLGDSFGGVAGLGDGLPWITKPVTEEDLLERSAGALLGTSSRSNEPLAPETAAAAERLAGRVLLVEDQPLNQKIVSMMLQKLGCEVEIAGNGQEAVAAVDQSGAFDVIFMDLQMPVMGGIEATQVIRSNFQLPKQPVIVALTGHALTGVREECQRAGMNHFLTKPVSLDDLRQCLRRCLPPRLVA